jgi:hypothetical protein
MDIGSVANNFLVLLELLPIKIVNNEKIPTIFEHPHDIFMYMPKNGII